MSGAIITPAVRDELEKLLAIVRRSNSGVTPLSVGYDDGWHASLHSYEQRLDGHGPTLLAALEDVRKQWEMR
jgi:hypothetical protein